IAWHCEHILSARARPRCSSGLELLSSAKPADVATSRRRIASLRITLEFPLSDEKSSRRPHWFGLGLLGGGARLMMVLQLRHENVSNCALRSSDLLLSIAIPQRGQCRIGGRDCAGIGPGLKAAALPTCSPRACAGPPNIMWRRKCRTRWP